MIDCNHVTLAFKKKVVLNKMDLTITPGYIYGLLGKNGEGKTTLLKILSGLLFPNNGDCRIDGREPRLREVAFLESMYFFPEDPVLPALKAKTYINMYAPFYKTFDRKICDKCLREFEIDPADKLNKLSLGQRKKVAISLAFAVNTPYLFMDEPTNGLDIPSKSVFRKLLASLMTEDRTIVISTHQVRDLESLIDAVLILDKREIVLNRSLDMVSKKLSFRTVREGDEPLFKQETIAGTVGVMENRDGDDTTPDLELLFNAVVGEKERIRQLFG